MTGDCKYKTPFNKSVPIWFVLAAGSNRHKGHAFSCHQHSLAVVALGPSTAPAPASPCPCWGHLRLSASAIMGAAHSSLDQLWTLPCCCCCWRCCCRYWHTNKALRARDRWLTVKGEKDKPKQLLDSRTNEVVFEVPKHYGEW